MSATIAGLQIILGLPERLRRALLHQGADFVLLLDREGVIRYASPSFERKLKYSLRRTQGRLVLDYVHPDDRTLVATGPAHRLADQEVPKEIEFRVRRGDGTYCWLAATALNRLRDPLLRSIVVTSRDVSERKEAEVALQASEVLLSAVVSHAPAVLFATDRDGLFTFYAGRPLGTDPEARRPAAGQSVADWLGDSPALRDLWQRVLEGEEFSTIVERGGLILEV